MQTYQYLPNHDESLLRTMKEVKYEYFRSRCDYWAVAESLGYAVNQQSGISLRNDRMCRYFKSKYDGRNCMYLLLRGTKYIWVEP